MTYERQEEETDNEKGKEIKKREDEGEGSIVPTSF